MKPDCSRFRGRLERALCAREGERPLELAWHAHLFACQDCRALLAAEEALDVLLASLPEPSLPSDLVQRVLARLRSRSDEATRLPAHLDDLLELDRPARTPLGLGARVLAGLAPERAGDGASERLDRLLERVPEPEVPAELASHVLAGLAAERHPVRSWRRSRSAALAAALLVGFFLVRFVATSSPSSSKPVEVAGLEVEEELLAALDVLENWELLTSSDLDFVVADLEPVEEELFYLEPEEIETWSEPEPDEEEEG